MNSADEIIQDLIGTRLPCKELSRLPTPAGPGFYAFFMRGGTLASFDVLSKDEFVYVGKSKELSGRPFTQHLGDRRTGSSAPRRSLGAILRSAGELDIKPRCRGKGKSEKDYTMYRFDDEGEGELTRWMIWNLDIAVFPFDGNLVEIEAALIPKAKPILNLRGWDNPYSTVITEMMDRCRVEARRQKTDEPYDG